MALVIHEHGDSRKSIIHVVDAREIFCIVIVNENSSEAFHENIAVSIKTL
jgi:hypothetical protein